MATSFPTSKDNFVNPQGTDSVELVSHSAQHANANDAIEALETKVGVDGSTDPVSLEYRLTNYQPAKISFTPPTNPLVGHIWFDNQTAEFYFFDGTYWIQGAAPQGTDLLHVSSNIVPDTTNTRTLGTSTKRWADVYIGPNTIHMTDTATNAATDLTVTNGILMIDGANLQVGQFKFIDNTIESTAPDINIQIGLTTSTGNLTLNRNVRIDSGKSLTFGDGTVQTTAPGVPVAYSPTWSGTGLAFTGTPATGSYMKVGKLVTFRFKVVCTTVTNFGTGQYSITLPFNVATNYQFMDGAIHRNSNGNHYQLKAHIDSGNVMTLWDGAGATDVIFDHNSPYSLTTSDYFYLTGTYEAE
jgi:hypothetical protein